MGKTLVAQQGDVLCFKMASMPKGIKKSENNVIALGEATGHSHRISPNDGATVAMFETESGEKWCEVSGGTATIVHEEHGPQTIEEGVWRFGIVKEYDPFLEETRSVID